MSTPLPSTQSLHSILVTNDDGVHSPLLIPLVEAAAKAPWCEKLSVSVPAEEHSWIGQAISRFKPIYYTREQLGSQEAMIVSGTPADSVAVALAGLPEDARPLVVSGINMGTNAGLGFHLNSGTVGAARQAILFGTKAIAVSAVMPPEIFEAWHTAQWSVIDPFRAQFAELAATAVATIGELLEPELWDGVDLYCIELPWGSDRSTPRVITHLSRTKYLGIFEHRREGMSGYRFAGIEWNNPVHEPSDSPTQTDVEVVRAGKVAITPIHYDLRPRSSDVLRRLQQKVERAE